MSQRRVDRTNEQIIERPRRDDKEPESLNRVNRETRHMIPNPYQNESRGLSDCNECDDCNEHCDEHAMRLQTILESTTTVPFYTAISPSWDNGLLRQLA